MIKWGKGPVNPKKKKKKKKAPVRVPMGSEVYRGGGMK